MPKGGEDRRGVGRARGQKVPRECGDHQLPRERQAGPPAYGEHAGKNDGEAYNTKLVQFQESGEVFEVRVPRRDHGRGEGVGGLLPIPIGRGARGAAEA